MRLLEEENPPRQLQLSYQRIAVIYNRKLHIIQQNITVILNNIVVSSTFFVQNSHPKWHFS